MELAVTFLLVTCRVTAMSMTAPLLGSRAVGRLPRLAISLAVTLVVVPLVPSVNIADSAELGSAVLSELLIGALLGLGVAIMFSAAQMAGIVLGQLAGLQMADQVDPNNGHSTTPLGQLFGILSLAVFALIDGPDMVVAACLETFVGLPLGVSLKANEVIPLLTELLQQSLVLTLRGVGPGVAALLVSSWVIGLIGRAFPQVNMLPIGLNSQLVFMLLAVFLTLGGSMWLFIDDWQQTIDVINTTLLSERGQLP